MTTWENIDRVIEENVTVTSDEAYERITSDLKLEDERDWWYLKQNTAWLVQEIPNISFLDIWDTLLESKKTLYGRNNWNVVVWNAGKSIEVVPQDFIRLKFTNEITNIANSDIDFDTITESSNKTTMERDQNYPYRIHINKTWYYRISYWWGIKPLSATEFSVVLQSDIDYITWDAFEQWNYWNLISWWRTISNVYLTAEDNVVLTIYANSWVNVEPDLTYLEIQFQNFNI